jgi:hypothetical protein
MIMSIIFVSKFSRSFSDMWDRYPLLNVTVPLQLLVTAILKVTKLLLITKKITSYVTK